MLGLSSFLLAGQPLVFYHYAAYMLPAAAAGVVSLPPWGLAASLLLPYGVLLMSLAVYAFARMQLGTATATIAPVALLLLPDASTYGLRNGFFGFHWLLFTAPGSGYGLAAAFTALTLMAIWRSRQLSACFWVGDPCDGGRLRVQGADLSDTGSGHGRRPGHARLRSYGVTPALPP